ncbi:MAG: cytochrome c3 family protein [Pelovirga sp.]
MKKTQRLLIFIIFGAVLPLMIIACVSVAPKTEASVLENSGHAVPMGTQDCIACHRAATPDAVQQWEQSAHGFALVHCQVCHGDEKNFARSPGSENCRSCHAAEVENNLAKPGTNCAVCHIAHNFTIHRVHQYK